MLGLKSGRVSRARKVAVKGKNRGVWNSPWLTTELDRHRRPSQVVVLEGRCKVAMVVKASAGTEAEKFRLADRGAECFA